MIDDERVDEEKKEIDSTMDGERETKLVPSRCGKTWKADSEGTRSRLNGSIPI